MSENITVNREYQIRMHLALVTRFHFIFLTKIQYLESPETVIMRSIFIQRAHNLVEQRVMWK